MFDAPQSSPGCTSSLEWIVTFAVGDDVLLVSGFVLCVQCLSVFAALQRRKRASQSDAVRHF